MYGNSKDYLGYQTWVVLKPMSPSYNIIYFPDFPEADGFYIQKKALSEDKAAIIYAKLENYLYHRIKAKDEIPISMGSQDLKTIYDPLCPDEKDDNPDSVVGSSLVEINIWDILNRVYPCEDKGQALISYPEKNVLPIKIFQKQTERITEKTERPKARTAFSPHFWAVIFDTTDDDLTNKKTYQVHFPELNDHSSVHYTITCLISDLDEAVEAQYLKLLKNRCQYHDLPQPWTKEQVQQWATKNKHDDLSFIVPLCDLDEDGGVFEMSLAEDHFHKILHIQKDLERFQNNAPRSNILKQRYPSDEHQRRWPPKDGSNLKP